MQGVKRMQGVERGVYRHRLCPAEDQARQLARTFGRLRCVHNWALALRTEARFVRHERIDDAETDQLLVRMKKEPEKSWLDDASSVPLRQALWASEWRVRELPRGPRLVPALPPEARPAGRHPSHRRVPVETRDPRARHDGVDMGA